MLFSWRVAQLIDGAFSGSNGELDFLVAFGCPWENYEVIHIYTGRCSPEFAVGKYAMELQSRWLIWETMKSFRGASLTVSSTQYFNIRRMLTDDRVAGQFVPPNITDDVSFWFCICDEQGFGNFQLTTVKDPSANFSVIINEIDKLFY